MTKFKVGDVIAMPFFQNQENKNEGTARLALIVEVYSDSYSIMPFTTKLHQEKNYNKALFIAASSTLGKKMGIPEDSLLIFDRRVEIKKIVAKPPILGNCGEDFLEEHNL